MDEITLLPSDTYMVTKLDKERYLYHDVLTMLYQPIIGMDAYSLLMMLWCEEEREVANHGIIFNTLNVNINRFLKMRQKLEGIGLLKSFENRTETYHSFIYQLQVPLTANEFFANNILNTLLLDACGEERYKYLAKKFKVTTLIPNNYMEVTQKMESVYQFSKFYLSRYENVYNKAYQDSKIPKTKIETIKETEEVNFEVLVHSLNPRIVDLNSVRSIEDTVLTLQKLYKLSLEELVKLIMQAANPETGIVNKEVLQNQVVNLKKADPVVHKIGTEQASDWALQGFSKRDIEVFNTAVQMSPLDFLTSIKEQKGGQRTSEEFYTIRNAVSNSSLPISAINIVIYELLVKQGYTELPQKLFDKLLDILGQNNIVEVSDVWKKLPNIIDNGRSSQNKQVKKQKAKKVITPEWEETKNITSANKEDIDDIKQKLDKLRGL